MHTVRVRIVTRDLGHVENRPLSHQQKHPKNTILEHVYMSIFNF